MAVPLPPLNFNDAGMASAESGTVNFGPFTVGRQSDNTGAYVLAGAVLMLALVVTRKKRKG